jgi:hypothetical protein
MENHLALADIEAIANVACFSIDFKVPFRLFRNNKTLEATL